MKWKHELTGVLFLTLHPSVNVIPPCHGKGWPATFLAYRHHTGRHSHSQRAIFLKWKNKTVIKSRKYKTKQKNVLIGFSFYQHSRREKPVFWRPIQLGKEKIQTKMQGRVSDEGGRDRQHGREHHSQAESLSTSVSVSWTKDKFSFYWEDLNIHDSVSDSWKLSIKPLLKKHKGLFSTLIIKISQWARPVILKFSPASLHNNAQSWSFSYISNNDHLAPSSDIFPSLLQAVNTLLLFFPLCSLRVFIFMDFPQIFISK